MDQPTPDRVLSLGLGFWGAKALLSAVELGVFATLAAGPATLGTLGEKLGLHQRSARDFLDALVALKVLERQDGKYRNAPDADLFLDPVKPTYVGGMLEMANARLYHFWGDLTEGLRTGRPQSESKTGRDFFGTLYAEPQRLRGFLSGMSGISAGAAQALAVKFDWSGYASVMDVGAAQGMVPVTLARMQPHLAVVGFDLPPVQPVFEAFVEDHGLSERVRFHPGNFFDDPLPQADVIVLGHILHDWDLEQKLALLEKVFEALPKGGAVVVYEAIIDDERRENAFGLLMSLNMLIETPGGFDFTGADCQSWMRQIGFVRTRVEPLAGPDSMVIGFKPTD